MSYFSTLIHFFFYVVQIEFLTINHLYPNVAAVYSSGRTLSLEFLSGSPEFSVNPI